MQLEQGDGSKQPEYPLPEGCSGSTPQAGGWWENIPGKPVHSEDSGKLPLLFKLLLFCFPPPTRKSQPLLETSCAIQRNIPTRSCRGQLPLPPWPSPELSPVPHIWPAHFQPSARPRRQRGICFSLSQPTSGRAAEGRASVERCLRSPGRAGSARGSLVLPPARRQCQLHFRAPGAALAPSECPPWGAGGLGRLSGGKKGEKLNSFLPLPWWGRCLRQAQLPTPLAAPLLLLLVLADPPASGRIYLSDPSFI